MNDKALLSKARNLVTALEQGDDAKANGILEKIAASREAIPFVEIGKLTRGLHNAMLTIRLDARLIGITKTDIPDAKERLNAVITKTEEAAHRTLNAVEELLLIVDTMAINADKILIAARRAKRRNSISPAQAIIRSRISSLRSKPTHRNCTRISPQS